MKMPGKRFLSSDWIVFSIITLGIAEILTQLVVLREFLAVFYGNELVIGILLANWLLISGFGGYVGRRVSAVADKHKLLISFHIVMAFLLAVCIFVIRSLYGFAFIRGELVSVTGISVAAFLILLPVCFITGFSLPLFSVLYSRRKNAVQIGRVYFFDSLSNMIGGVLFSFVLIYLLDAFQIALVVLVMNLFAAMLISTKLGKRLFSLAAAVLLVIAVILFSSIDIDLVSTQQQYPGQGVAFMQDSVYGRYVVTRSADQLNFFENGVPLFSTNDPASNEEKVHYALLQHRDVRRVLLISGGVSGTALEVLKYPDIEEVDYVELDPLVVFIGKKFTDNLDDARIHVFNMDARLFVRQSMGRDEYDAVIIDMPDPATAQANRFYTEEFFGELKQVMADGAVVSLSLSSGVNYLNEETRRLNAAVYNSLKKHFRNVLILPGDTAYFIASDAGLSYNAYDDIPVDTVYVKKEYMYDRLDRERIDYVYSALGGSGIVNRDFRPVAYYYHLLYWLGHFETNYFVFIGILVAFLVFVVWRIRPVQFAVLSAGFAGMSLELVILIGFQVIYGNVYHKIGVIVTSFMVGLALGAWFMNRRLGSVRSGSVAKIIFLVGCYSVVLPLLLFLLSMADSSYLVSLISAVVFPLMTVVIGFLVGALFPAAARLHFSRVGRTAGLLYFYDYAGACFGAVLVSVLFIPVVGMFGTCIIIAFLCFFAAFANGF